MNSPALHDGPAAAAAPAAHADRCSLTAAHLLRVLVPLAQTWQWSNPIANPIDALWIGCQLQQSSGQCLKLCSDVQ